MRLFTLAILLSALLAAPAEAQYVEPLPAGTWVLPVDGATHQASSWPQATPFEMLGFAVYLNGYDELPEQFDIAVASGAGTTSEGLLTPANVIDRYAAPARPDVPSIFTARTALDSRWLGTPGTYHWQASFTTGDGDVYAGPVRSLTVVPAPPPDPPQAPAAVAPFVAPPPAAPARPPLAASTARIVVRRAIAAGTHRVARGLVYRCVTAPGAGTCRPSWRAGRYRYRGTLRITSGAGGISATFEGTRTRGSQRRGVTFSASM
jgi:hypothetical protein